VERLPVELERLGPAELLLPRGATSEAKGERRKAKEDGEEGARGDWESPRQSASGEGNLDGDQESPSPFAFHPDGGAAVTERDPWQFELATARDAILHHFDVASV